MAKWAYKRVTFGLLQIDTPEFEAKINELGGEGWELVTCFDRERGGSSRECFFLFKREAKAEKD